ncbi:MAG: hypothetical protein NZO16_04875 [Deltaproteobacteria bacterium]|nr:hypothetical protein [Deltaproteobacteria bacterium]
MGYFKRLSVVLFFAVIGVFFAELSIKRVVVFHGGYSGVPQEKISELINSYGTNLELFLDSDYLCSIIKIYPFVKSCYSNFSLANWMFYFEVEWFAPKYEIYLDGQSRLVDDLGRQIYNKEDQQHKFPLVYITDYSSFAEYFSDFHRLVDLVSQENYELCYGLVSKNVIRFKLCNHPSVTFYFSSKSDFNKLAELFKTRIFGRLKKLSGLDDILLTFDESILLTVKNHDIS